MHKASLASVVFDDAFAVKPRTKRSGVRNAKRPAILQEVGCAHFAGTLLLGRWKCEIGQFASRDTVRSVTQVARVWWCALLFASACSKTAPTTRTIELEGIRAQIPASWSPSPPTQIERLVAASRRRDPAAEVQLLGVGTNTSPAPMLSLMMIVHSREYTLDATARSMARDSVTETNDIAAAQGVDAKPTYSCEVRHCTLRMTLGFPAGSMHLRSHLWRADERVYTATCMGTDLGTVDACELPAAPSHAELVPPDEPS